MVKPISWWTCFSTLRMYVPKVCCLGLLLTDGELLAAKPGSGITLTTDTNGGQQMGTLLD